MESTEQLKSRIKELEEENELYEEMIAKKNRDRTDLKNEIISLKSKLEKLRTDYSDYRSDIVSLGELQQTIEEVLKEK